MNDSLMWEIGEHMSRTFLVTGPTGHTGRNTVNALLEAGVNVRAFVHSEDQRSESIRKLGAEIVTGNILDFESIRAAVEGVEGAYFEFPIMPGIHQATTYFAQAAKEAKLKIVVNMSQISARREAKSHAAQDHWLAEQIFDWSSIPVTHIRPTLFAEWALHWIDQIETGTLRLPFGTGKHAPIATADQARVIANILLSPEEHIGKVYPLYGEKEYTFAEITEEISKVIGKPLRYEQVDAWEMKKLATGVPETAENKRFLHKIEGDTLWQHFQEIAKDHQNGVFAGTNDTVERITGKRPISLPDVLQAHRSAFIS
jgi:NAD(P)H dehydrogenase (quinone)